MSIPQDFDNVSNIKQLFAMYERVPVKTKVTARDCISNKGTSIRQIEPNLLSNVFFSKENKQIIRNAIRAGVYKYSNSQYIIDQPDCDALQLYMDSIYTQTAINLPDHITDQVAALNQMVVEACVPAIYSEAQSYMKYRRDIEILAVPPPMPILASNIDKTNYMLPTWFGPKK